MNSSILYAKQEVGGIIVRPDSREVMQKAAEGHPIEVLSGNDYINLYHVFERMRESAPRRYGKMQLVRRQIGRTRWMIYAVRDPSDVPEVELDKGYDPKRGRYKRYAQQLAAGDSLVFSTRGEAVKARRAWQLYVPAEKRRRLRSSVKRVGKSDRYMVMILERD